MNEKIKMKLYHVGLKNLERRKFRTALLTVGLGIAVAIEVALVGLTKSLESDFAKKLDEYGANIVILPKANELSLDYGGIALSGVSFGTNTLTTDDAVKIKTIKNSGNISTIAPQLLTEASVGGKKVIVAGIDFNAEFRLKRWWRYAGSQPVQPNDILLGSSVAKALGSKPGDTLKINSVKFEVAAVLNETGSQDDRVAFISLPVAQKIFGSKNELSLIEVSALCYNCPIDEIVRQTQDKLPNANVSALRQTIESRMDVMHRLQHFSEILSVAVVLFAALMIFVTMMSSIGEREKEIGIFRAVGFKRKHVILVIVVESIIMSLGAGIFGYATGLFGAMAAQPLMGIQHLQGFGISAFLTSLVLAMTVGVTAALYPAYKASRLEPTAALRAL
ncbi:MAG: ABC transporter permease [Bacteroidota bacterium]|nr:ABC transporter permease [Bacteroidota bacterium]